MNWNERMLRLCFYLNVLGFQSRHDNDVTYIVVCDMVIKLCVNWNNIPRRKMLSSLVRGYWRVICSGVSWTKSNSHINQDNYELPATVMTTIGRKMGAVEKNGEGGDNDMGRQSYQRTVLPKDSFRKQSYQRIVSEDSLIRGLSY